MGKKDERRWLQVFDFRSSEPGALGMPSRSSAVKGAPGVSRSAEYDGQASGSRRRLCRGTLRSCAELSSDRRGGGDGTSLASAPGSSWRGFGVLGLDRGRESEEESSRAREDLLDVMLRRNTIVRPSRRVTLSSSTARPRQQQAEAGGKVLRAAVLHASDGRDGRQPIPKARVRCRGGRAICGSWGAWHQRWMKGLTNAERLLRTPT